MKKLVFYSGLYNVGSSNAARAQLDASGLIYDEVTYGVDEHPHTQIPAIPCVILDVEGHPFETFRVINGAQIKARLNLAPDTYTPLAPPQTATELLIAKKLWTAQDRDEALRILLRAQP